jgi:hypothetical protein
MPAQISTPRVANNSAGRRPVRKRAYAVRSPPSSKMTASARFPTQKLKRFPLGRVARRNSAFRIAGLINAGGNAYDPFALANSLSIKGWPARLNGLRRSRAAHASKGSTMFALPGDDHQYAYSAVRYAVP